MPTIAFACAASTMGPTTAFAQQIQARFPVVQAVAQTVSDVGDAASTMISSAPSLSELVEANKSGAPLDEQGKCLATAVYFESMGEPLQGQLAVANVVINRARSGQYPSTWCGVVKQRAQFSFVHNGRFPYIKADCEQWKKAQAIARIAALNLTSALPTDVLWYHADYVAPKWRSNLTKVSKIGAHIFYRA